MSLATAIGRPRPPVNPDAVVIGAGPNGLVPAIVLASGGWSVLVLEANDQPGGAVRTAEVTAPGFGNDLFSAFYPMTAVSPVISELRLEEFGLQIDPRAHGPRPSTRSRAGRGPQPQPRRHGRLARSVCGGRRRQLPASVLERWRQVEGPLMGSLLRPFPLFGTRSGSPRRRLRDGGPGPPVTAAGAEDDRGEVRRRIGRAPVRRELPHADLTPDASGSDLFAWMLVSLGPAWPSLRASRTDARRADIRTAGLGRHRRRASRLPLIRTRR